LGARSVPLTLSFVYTNELRFTPQEDVRSLVDQLQIDRKQINRTLTTSPLYGPSEWEFQRLLRQDEEREDFDGFDSRTVQSVSSTGTRRSAISPPPMKPALQATRPASSTPGSGKTPSTLTKPLRSAQAAATTTPNKGRTLPKTQATPTTAKPVPVNTAPSSVSPKGVPRPGYTPRPADPHPHPCPPPLPASALSIYMLSHRYRLEALQGLARDRIIEQMTPENCMPML
jgi:hypothetical protein